MIDCRLRCRAKQSRNPILPLRDSKPYSYLNAPDVNSCGELSAGARSSHSRSGEYFRTSLSRPTMSSPMASVSSSPRMRPAIVHVGAPLTLVTDLDVRQRGSQNEDGSDERRAKNRESSGQEESRSLPSKAAVAEPIPWGFDGANLGPIAFLGLECSVRRLRCPVRVPRQGKLLVLSLPKRVHQ